MRWQDKAHLVHQTVCDGWPTYGSEDRRFLALALAGEVGEALNMLKKEWRGDFKADDPDFRRELGLELADIRLYLELLAKACDVDLDRACEEKLDVCLERWPHAAKAVRLAESGKEAK